MGKKDTIVGGSRRPCRGDTPRPPGKATPAPASAAPVRPGKGSRAVRLFLMIAGGLAAPCLALAAFFLSGSDSEPKPSKAQSARVTTTTRPAGLAPANQGAPVTTTTTTAPVRSAAGLRDPFAPLVTAAPAPR